MRESLIQAEYAYSSYAGADIVAALQLPRSFPYVLGTLGEIRISTHRPAYEVLSLGCTMARGFTRGPRVVAGNLTFVAFNTHLMYELANELRRQQENDMLVANINRNTQMEDIIINAYDNHEDELPLFDIIVNFQNEMGSVSHMLVFGVQLVDSQVGYGTNIPVPHISYTFVAIDYKAPTPGIFDASTGSTSTVLHDTVGQEYFNLPDSVFQTTQNSNVLRRI